MSTRKVDGLVKALGASLPPPFLDATYCKLASTAESQAMFTTGVRADGWREVLGFSVCDSEDAAFGTSFLRSLKARDLAGVQLVISDAHTGLKQAITAVLLGAAWQRCRVHFLRNVLAQVPRGALRLEVSTLSPPDWSRRCRARRRPPPTSLLTVRSIMVPF